MAETHSVRVNSALTNVLHLLDERVASFEPTRAIFYLIMVMCTWNSQYKVKEKILNKLLT